ncbi:PTS sugar transporter subunit IIA [Paenibacillus puerhi]|uniref:PTS sugar transporter subunit IIA n=1 Tax=Paenibacillus puerhi TaxID=2692622 RepID=UPI001356E55C|nr:fructose PTS transporter subunit IIA [Paenibacillus puerhi]
MREPALLQTTNVILDIQASDRDDCIRQMGERLQASGYVTDLAAYMDSVLAREEHTSTAIGFGVAIPHGKSSGVARPGVAFARTAQPLEWNALDGKPVSMMIMLAIPQEEAGKEHLRILASVSRKLIHESFRRELLEAKTEEEVIRILESAL